LAAGLRPDPRSPRHPNRKRVLNFKGERRKKGRKRRGGGKEGRGKGGEEATSNGMEAKGEGRGRAKEEEERKGREGGRALPPKLYFK